MVCPKCGVVYERYAIADGVCQCCDTAIDKLALDADGDYQDYACPYCAYEWRVYGNGGLVFGCWPCCPKCGTMAEAKQ